MLAILVALAWADTGDTGDTGVYVDTGAKAEKVFEQESGCGSGALLVALGILGARRGRARAGDPRVS